MVSLVLLIFFFWILVLFYPLAVAIIVLTGWIIKKWGDSSSEDKESRIIRHKQIDFRTDRLKEIVFQVSVWLVLFVAAPFAMYCIYVGIY
ncbi:MAG: hypothetical protein HQK61_00725 [Desulfamplus sp.]|nr:hypothetical protein [Desulfamplus sp.]